MTARARKRRDALATDPANVELVEKIAERIKATLPDVFTLDDLIGEGMLALLQAAESYDPKAFNGTPWNYWARMKIRGAILESVRRKRYTENTRVSIDDPGRSVFHASDHGENDAKYDTEQWRAFLRMATQPSAPIAIDRKRQYAEVSKAISFLHPTERELLRIWYADDEPNLRTVAKRLQFTPAQVEAIHANAIAKLQARLTGAAVPRAEMPEAA